jgi:hypothetical protein
MKFFYLVVASAVAVVFMPALLFSVAWCYTHLGGFGALLALIAVPALFLSFLA